MRSLILFCIKYQAKTCYYIEHTSKLNKQEKKCSNICIMYLKKKLQLKILIKFLCTLMGFLHIFLFCKQEQKSVNLQYSMLGQWDDGPKELLIKRLMFQELFFFMISCKFLCENPFNLFSYFFL